MSEIIPFGLLVDLYCVDPFAFGVVRMLIGFARISSFCESVRIANQFAGRQSRRPEGAKKAQYPEALGTISRSIADPGRIRANPFRLRIVANCEWSTQDLYPSESGPKELTVTPKKSVLYPLSGATLLWLTRGIVRRPTYLFLIKVSKFQCC